MKVVLHIGAHKTATTYIQRRLAANEHILLPRGIAFVAPSEYRPALLRARSDALFLKDLRLAREHRQRKVLTGLLKAAEATNKRRFVLSEENLLGTPERILSGDWFYDRAGHNLRHVLQVCERRPVRVLFAIRNYADFFPSAYAEALKLNSFVPFDEKLRQFYLGMDRGWPDILAEIGTTLPPGSDLRIWQYEGMRRYEPGIMAAFTGTPTANELEALEDRPQQGGTKRAIAHLHRLSERGVRVTRHRARRVLRASPKKLGHAAFDPWTNTERAFLTDRYNRDVARIAATWRGSFVHPLIPVDLPGE